MTTILSVDPGKASGVALIEWNGDSATTPTVQWSCEVSEEEFPAAVLRALDGHVDGVACEKFTITVQTAKNSQAPYSLELIGVLKYLCREHGTSVTLQTPANAKAMFPNTALKLLGTWHRGGEGHALDAIRHGLLYLVTKERWVPQILLEKV